jgi:hypothetical protein
MDRLAKRGLDKTAQLGMGSDARPSKEVATYIMDAFPNLPWARGGHQEWTELGSTGGKIGLAANVYPYKFLADWPKGLYSCYGWNRPLMRVLFPRIYEPNYPMTMTRLLPEMSVLGMHHGIGRIGLDFWPVIKPVNPGHPNTTIHGRYAASSWGVLDAMVKGFVPPGPDGACDSAHLETLREGIQESEARIAIESALIDPAARAKLGEDLAKRCQQGLDERAVAWMPNFDNQASAGFQVRVYEQVLLGWDNYAYTGNRSIIFTRYYQATPWQDRTEKLFNLAAEVDAAVKK